MTQEEKEAGFRPVECKSCEESIRDPEQVYHGDEGTLYAGEPLCETCYQEDEPCATIHYGNGGPEGCERDYPYTISSARNDTQGDFKVAWHRTDAWRGYYEAKSDRYVQVFTDAILSGHESAEMLKKLNDLVEAAYQAEDIDYAKVFCRTSNVFFAGYELWVKREEQERADEIIHEVKQKVNFDNPLYSTGILFDRETVEQAKKLTGIENPRSDSELVAAALAKLGKEVN